VRSKSIPVHYRFIFDLPKSNRAERDRTAPGEFVRMPCPTRDAVTRMYKSDVVVLFAAGNAVIARVDSERRAHWAPTAVD